MESILFHFLVLKFSSFLRFWKYFTVSRFIDLIYFLFIETQTQVKKSFQGDKPREGQC